MSNDFCINMLKLICEKYVELAEISKKKPVEEPEVFTRESLIDAMKAFENNDDGIVNLDEFREILTTKGEPLTNKEFEKAVIPYANVDKNNCFKSVELIDTILNKLQRLA